MLGYAIYDGPTELYRVHFAGFYGRNANPASYAFMNMGAALKSAAHIARQISFDPRVPIAARADFIEYPTSSIWSSQLIDEDGAISGIPNTFIIPEIHNSRPFLFTEPYRWDKGFNLPPAGDSANCTKLGYAFAFACNEKAGLLVINAPALLSTGAACVNYTRSDGLMMTDCTRDAFFHTSVRLNKPSLWYGFETIRHVPGLTLYLLEVIPGEFIIFRVQNVTNSSRFTLRLNRNQRTSIPFLNSFAQVSLANVTSAFLNATSRTAWIKLVSSNYDYSSDFGSYRSQFRYNGTVQVEINRN
jgi:hypothetical protein